MAIDTSPEHPAPVRQIVQAIGGWVDRLGAVWVEGQVTQISRRGGMSTVFMTLRDQLADVSMQVTCARDVVDSLATPLVEGAQIVCHAKPSFYPNRGSLSLQVREIRMVGEGELLARLERLRRLLAAEGLFAEHRKRPLPLLPHTVGLVTAQNSAAERDVVEIAGRRWPGVRLSIRYAAMQGPHATREIIDALAALEADPEVEVIVIARGGGSVEDLLPFSDEGLIRRVHDLRTPVVSAIGHESDSPILDLVADLRAATPTDAAKRVVPDVAEEGERIRQLRTRALSSVRHRLDRESTELAALRSRPSLADPRRGIDERLAEAAELHHRVHRALAHRLGRAEEDLAHQLARVRALSPLATLRRGYAVVTDEHDRALTDAGDVRPDQPLSIRLAAGRVGAVATTIESETAPADEEISQ